MLQKANKWSTKPTKQRIEWVPVHFIWEDIKGKKVKKVDEFSIQVMYKEDPEIQVLTKCSNGSMFDFGVSIIL